MFAIGLALAVASIVVVNTDSRSAVKKAFDKTLAVDCVAALGLAVGLDLILAGSVTLAWEVLS